MTTPRVTSGREGVPAVVGNNECRSVRSLLTVYLQPRSREKLALTWIPSFYLVQDSTALHGEAHIQGRSFSTPWYLSEKSLISTPRGVFPW